MFESIDRPCELIFCVLVKQKSDFDEVKEVVSITRMALRIHNLPSGHLKMHLL
jgi:hypothetical protein